MAVNPVDSRVLASSQYGRRAIQHELNARGFRSFLFGPNIETLRRISLEKYQKFLVLLKIVGDHFKANYDTDGKLVGLNLPTLDELRRIRVGRILETPAALELVRRRCVSAQGVDLKILPWIYDTQMPTEEPSTPPVVLKK